MPLQFTLRATSHAPIEVAGLVPDLLRDKPLAEIERLPIHHGNERLAVAELFDVAGSAADEHIEFAGDVSGVHRIGAAMHAGAIHVAGNAGRHVGSQMTGGEIIVDGSASDWVGGEMRGGLIRVHGAAGHLVGAAYRGSVRGMRGGVILVDGDAGDEVGHTMRRGLVAVGGTLGNFAAINMIAGSVMAFGRCGSRPAAGMRRGTLAMLGERPVLLPTFRTAGRYEPEFLRIYMRTLRDLGFALAHEVDDAAYELFHGDLVAGGRGEIILRK